MSVRTETLIVGAGISGLMIASHLVKSCRGVTLLEKSRGVGGRIATRRSALARFDHGAQFYTDQEPIRPLHERWMKKSFVRNWFERNEKTHFASPLGLTTIAKDLAEGLDVKLEHKVVKLRSYNQNWFIETEGGASFEASRVILTAPLPQSLELLRGSNIPYDVDLEAVTYAKAIVALIEWADDSGSEVGRFGYVEPESSMIFSIADQKAKGVSAAPAWTVTLNPDTSEKLFDQADQRTKEMILAELKKLFPKLRVHDFQIKKWKYAHPLHSANGLFNVAAENLILAGDGFGGPSINGAARSANAVIQKLNLSE